MQWQAIVSTFLGALIGVGSTIAVDRFRWSRETSREIYRARRQLYGDYLADLSTTRDALRVIARGMHPADLTRWQAAIEAFRAVNLYSRRYQISMTAPAGVVAAATESLRQLRAFRDVVGANNEYRSQVYVDARERYEASLTELIQVFRRDLKPLTGLEDSLD